MIDQSALQSILNTTRARPQIVQVAGHRVLLDRQPPGNICDTFAKHGIACTGYGFLHDLGHYLLIETLTSKGD
jgi:hypothetical protein